ncbi:hypothetical protein EMPG_17574 [Blastomyces silverae]|uniref:Uncharacterized protein n=1 Tax=Blastomyces silverae TaxID=2060906 RepID=A0A0H1BCH6_9EURO|nr:hypothetical protein EMPG_17574 [Blastomyces silverae]
MNHPGGLGRTVIQSHMFMNHQGDSRLVLFTEAMAHLPRLTATRIDIPLLQCQLAGKMIMSSPSYNPMKLKSSANGLSTLVTMMKITVVESYIASSD